MASTTDKFLALNRLLWPAPQYMFSTPGMLVYAVMVLVGVGVSSSTLQYIENTYAEKRPDGSTCYTYKLDSRTHQMHRFLYVEI